MRKVLAVIFIISLCVSFFMLSSCKKGEASSEKIVLKVANYALLEAGYEEFWKQVEVSFESQNPSVDIQWVTAPYGEIVNQVINMAGGGDKVDCVFSETGWIPGFEDAGLAAPIDSILPKEFLDDFYSEVMKSFEIGGRAYGIPLYISPYVLYYNKSLFEQAGLDPNSPPKTYDEMLIMAEKLSTLTDANGNKVYAFGQTTASVPVSGSSINAMIFNYGGDVLDSNGDLSIDNQGFRDTFAMLKILDDKGYNPQNAKLKDLRNLFALGQLAMYYDQSWGFNGIRTINPDSVNFTASAPPLSGGVGSGESLLQAHCFVLIDNGEERKDALSKFVQFVISEEVLSDYLANLTPAYPATRSMEHISSVTNNPVLQGAAGSAQHVKPETFIPQLKDLNLELCSLAQAVTVSNKDVDEAINEFERVIRVKLGD